MALNKTKIRGLVAFITGASSGIGRACCLELARRGCLIAAVARNKEKLDKVVGECQKLGAPKTVAIVADLVTPEGAQSAIDACVQQLGGLNILVNSAGVAKHLDDSLEEWEKCIEINLTSLMRVTRLAIPHLEKTGGASIINMASDLGREPSAGSAPYAASKHGVVGFSLSMFEALREKGIKVCSIEPGYVNTPMPSDRNKDRAKMIQPEDIALTVAFVAKFPSTACPTEIFVVPQREPVTA